MYETVPSYHTNIFPYSISNRIIIPFRYSISDRTIIPYQQYIKPYHHTIPTYTRACERAASDDGRVSSAQEHMPSGLYCCTNTTSTPEHTTYIYHTAAPTPQVHKSMPSLVRCHTAVPKRLLAISNMTSDGRASSALLIEHMPSGRQSRNEYRYHTAVPTRQIHKQGRWW